MPAPTDTSSVVALLDAVPRSSAPGPTRASLRGVAGDVTSVAALAWWATSLTYATGGREPHALSWGLVLVAVASALVRPWRRLPGRVVALALAPGAAAWVVVATAPTGGAGADDAASYTYAGAVALLALAWAADAVRRQLLVVAVVGAAALQLVAGWAAWAGTRTEPPATLFYGSFAWHNQAGTFLAVGAVVGAALVADGRRPLALLGWCLAPLCVAGTVFTTSRGALIGLALGAALVVVAAACRSGRAAAAAAVVRTLVLAGACWVVTWGLTGPPFFTSRFPAAAATQARAESFEGNGVQRLEDWRRAWEIFQHWPVTGAGFNSYTAATLEVTERRDGVVTAFAHNGYLQAAADGGLVLAVPLALALAAIAVVAARSLPAALRTGDLVRPGALAAYVVLLLHSGMDFDWTYPSLLAQTALVGVLALPVAGVVRDEVALPRRREVAVALAVGVLLALGAVGGIEGGLDLNAPL